MHIPLVKVTVEDSNCDDLLTLNPVIWDGSLGSWCFPHTSCFLQELVGQVPTPCVLVEMGSGNSEKSRMIIDILLSKQQNLTYMPVDISEGMAPTCYSHETVMVTWIENKIRVRLHWVKMIIEPYFCIEFFFKYLLFLHFVSQICATHSFIFCVCVCVFFLYVCY